MAKSKAKSAKSAKPAKRAKADNAAPLVDLTPEEVSQLARPRDGFEAHAPKLLAMYAKYGDELRIISNHCPFGDAAIEHPVICAVDRGMVKGMLGELYGDAETLTEASRAEGAEACITAISG